MGVMERRELDVLAQGLDDLSRDQDGARKRFPPVHHAVSDGMDLPFVGDDAVILAQEDRQDVFDGLCVIDDLSRDADLVPVVAHVAERRFAHADPFHAPPRECLPASGLDHLVLDG